MKHLRGRPTLSGCAEYCLRVVGLLWAVLGVPGAPSGRVWPVGSGGGASRGCIHTSKIVSRKVHPSLKIPGLFFFSDVMNKRKADMAYRSRAHRHPAHPPHTRRPRARPTPAGRKGSDSLGWQQNEYLALHVQERREK